MIYFSSDHHFGHFNCIKYCTRPFSTVEEMDEEMIRRWNEKISPNDTVYYLGDFTLKDRHFANKIISRLNGTIHFITGSHDWQWLNSDWMLQPTRGIWEGPYISLELSETENPKYPLVIALFHYPIAVWDRSHYGAWHLYGHVHHKDFILPGFAMNVGVDHHNFYPVSYDEVKQHMIDLGWYEGWKAEFIK